MDIALNVSPLHQGDPCHVLQGNTKAKTLCRLYTLYHHQHDYALKFQTRLFILALNRDKVALYGFESETIRDIRHIAAMELPIANVVNRIYCTCLHLCSEHCISLKGACTHCVYLNLVCNMYCGNVHKKTINLSVWPGSCSCSHICLMRLNERHPIRIIVRSRRPYYWMCFHIPSCFQVEVEMSFIYSRAALNRQKH